ncbi:MAG: hypothetical protein Tsb0020_44440 [Haliangiales bacterium]
MFTGLLIALLALVTILGGRAMWQRRQSALSGGSERLALPGAGGDGGDQLLSRTIRDLRPRDIVTWDGRDFVVEGVASYEEEGHRWLAGRVNDGTDEHWLVVGLERGGGLTARMLKLAPEIEMEGMPPEILVTDNDTRYRLDKRGTATVQVRGQTGLNLRTDVATGTAERCRWWVYDAPGDGSVIVEQWGGEYRVLRGKEVRPESLDLMPGS